MASRKRQTVNAQPKLRELLRELPRREFSTTDVAKFCGVSVRKVISWTDDLKYFKPSVADAAGHASKRKWNQYDLFRAMIIKRLTDMGLTPRIVRWACEILQDESVLLHTPYLLIDQEGGLNPTDQGPQWFFRVPAAHPTPIGI